MNTTARVPLTLDQTVARIEQVVFGHGFTVVVEGGFFYCPWCHKSADDGHDHSCVRYLLGDALKALRTPENARQNARPAETAAWVALLQDKARRAQDGASLRRHQANTFEAATAAELESGRRLLMALSHNAGPRPFTEQDRVDQVARDRAVAQRMDDEAAAFRAIIQFLETWPVGSPTAADLARQLQDSETRFVSTSHKARLLRALS
jgi:hypothetical protein